METNGPSAEIGEEKGIMHVMQRTQNANFVTSLFIAVPMFLAFESNNWVFALATSATLAASLLNWTYFVHSSMFHWADRLCGAATLICVCAQRPYLIVWTVATAAIFLVGRHYYMAGRRRQAACCHFAFRYSAFWLCYYHTAKNIHGISFVLLTITYVWCVLRHEFGITYF